MIAESELLPPGYKLAILDLKKDIDIGEYDGIFKLNYYDEETNKEHIVDSKIM